MKRKTPDKQNIDLLLKYLQLKTNKKVKPIKPKKK